MDITFEFFLINLFTQFLRITEWFSVQDSVIHARGLLRDS